VKNTSMVVYNPTALDLTKAVPKSKIPHHIIEAAADYAGALDEIGGEKLADTLLEDDELPAAIKALNKLNKTTRDEARWICGWFRGIADLLGVMPVDVLRASRGRG
jgi:hypothetical protein